VFTSDRGQIICLPNEAAFPADVHHVDVLKIGNSVLITPQSMGRPA
jgi:virulence-associated protein VagC